MPVVTGDVKRIAGTTVTSGEVRFTATTPVVQDPNGKTTSLATSVAEHVVTLDGTGTFSTTLPATGDDWVYRVEIVAHVGSNRVSGLPRLLLEVPASGADLSDAGIEGAQSGRVVVNRLVGNSELSAAIAPIQQTADNALTTAQDAVDTVEAIEGPISTRLGALEVLGGLEPGDVSDATVQNLITQEATGTRIALNAATDEVTTMGRASEGKAMRQSAAGVPKTVAITSMSLGYGQDTSATGTNPPVNGASQARSSVPTTEAFTDGAALVSPGPVTLIDQTYPGDTTEQALSRWTAGSSGDVEVFWLDTNDANSYGGPEALDDEQSLTNLRLLIQRAKDRGAEAVIVGGAPVQNAPMAHNVFAAAATHRAVAERLGARYLDAGELLTGLPVDTKYWTDGVHGTPRFYSAIGHRLAALTGPRGSHPVRVAPGVRVTAQDRLFTGATPSDHAQLPSGSYYRISEGQSLTLAVDVQAPVVPVVKLVMSGDNTAGVGSVSAVYHGGTSGKATKNFSFGGSTNTNTLLHFAYVPLHEYMGLGPDTITLECTAGTIQVEHISFAPVPAAAPMSGAIDTGGLQACALPAVGASGHTGWQASVDPLTGAPLSTDTRWTLDVALGNQNSGVLLAQSIYATNTTLIRSGYMILRNGSNLILRTYDTGGGVSDQTVPAVFTSTGVERALIEVEYNVSTAALSVRVNGAVRGSFASVSFGYLAAGLIAENGGAGIGVASGVATVHQP